jgi:hypothetical protein
MSSWTAKANIPLKTSPTRPTLDAGKAAIGGEISHELFDVPPFEFGDGLVLQLSSDMAVIEAFFVGKSGSRNLGRDGPRGRSSKKTRIRCFSVQRATWYGRWQHP